MPFTAAELESLNERLWNYDVRDGGWENEQCSAVFNALHVGKEICNVALGRKSFLDPEHVAREIAPDAVLYALRLGRWYEFGIEDMMEYDDLATETYWTVSNNQVPMPDEMLAYNAAGLLLGQADHDLDHANLREQTLSEFPARARSASQLLLDCAEIQIEAFTIDFDQAYDARIADLRVRRNIPEPTA